MRASTTSAGVIAAWREPHIDRVLVLDSGSHIVGLKHLNSSDPVFAEHSPGLLVYPGSLLIGNVISMTLRMFDGFWGAVSVMELIEVTFGRPARPGETLRIEVWTPDVGAVRHLMFEVVSDNNNALVAGGTICISITSRGASASWP